MPAAPERGGDSPAGTARLEFAGVAIETEDAVAAAWLRGAEPWARALRGSNPPDVPPHAVVLQRGRVTGDATGQQVELWGRVSAGLVDTAPVFSVAGGRACIADPNTIVLDCGAEVGGAGAAELLEAVLFELLAGCGYLAIHASVVSRGHCGALITGNSGAGKSTLAYLCGCAGAEVVTDDVALVRREGATWTALATSRELRLLPHPAMTGITSAPVDADGKRRVTPGSTALRATLDRVLLLDGPRGPRSSLQPASRAAVLEALLGQAALALRPGVVDCQIDEIGEFAALQAGRLRPGADLLEDPALAVALLFDDELWS